MGTNQTRTLHEPCSNQGRGRGIVNTSLHRWLNRLLFVYILFLFLWGLNYHRIGIKGQLGIKDPNYDTADLRRLQDDLLIKVNKTRAQMAWDHSLPKTNKTLFDEAVLAYQQTEKKFPFLAYHQPSLKSSLFGPIGNYLGFSGYYNPFTGEAQVNTTVPTVLKPFISCHEIAHQLGYASESEANFVGYLAAIHSNNQAVQYSAYLEMFLYANRNYFHCDSTAAGKYRQALSPAVQSDIREIIRFNKAHESILEPLFTTMFDLLLKSQQQKQGVLSYHEVVGLVIAFDKSKFKSNSNE